MDDLESEVEIVDRGETDYLRSVPTSPEDLRSAREILNTPLVPGINTETWIMGMSQITLRLHALVRELNSIKQGLRRSGTMTPEFNRLLIRWISETLERDLLTSEYSDEDRLYDNLRRCVEERIQQLREEVDATRDVRANYADQTRTTGDRFSGSRTFITAMEDSAFIQEVTNRVADGTIDQPQAIELVEERFQEEAADSPQTLDQNVTYRTPVTRNPCMEIRLNTDQTRPGTLWEDMNISNPAQRRSLQVVVALEREGFLGFDNAQILTARCLERFASPAEEVIFHADMERFDQMLRHRWTHAPADMVRSEVMADILLQELNLPSALDSALTAESEYDALNDRY